MCKIFSAELCLSHLIQNFPTHEYIWIAKVSRVLLVPCWLLDGWEECRLASIIRNCLPSILKTRWQGTMANVKRVTQTFVCYRAAKIISCFLLCMFQQGKHAVSWRHAFLLAFSPCWETDPAKWSMQVFSYLHMQSNISEDKCGH